jgi:hypothetical protein
VEQVTVSVSIEVAPTSRLLNVPSRTKDPDGSLAGLTLPLVPFDLNQILDPVVATAEVVTAVEVMSESNITVTIDRAIWALNERIFMG